MITDTDLADPADALERLMLMRFTAQAFTADDAAAVVTAVERVMAGRIYLDDRLQEQLLERLAMPLTAHPVSGGALPGGIDSLTNRELEVFALLGQGLTTLTIAERLHVSVKTVECHRDKIKRKLGLSGSAALIRRAVQWTLQPG